MLFFSGLRKYFLIWSARKIPFIVGILVAQFVSWLAIWTFTLVVRVHYAPCNHLPHFPCATSDVIFYSIFNKKRSPCCGPQRQCNFTFVSVKCPFSRVKYETHVSLFSSECLFVVHPAVIRWEYLFATQMPLYYLKDTVLLLWFAW